MRGRHRKAGFSLSAYRKSSPVVLAACGGCEAQIPSVDEVPYEARFPVDSSMYESGSFASRCSVRLINEVVGKFDEGKKQLVQSIGFHGILHFPAKQFNRKFSLWLMSCVCVDSSSINIGEHISMKFSKSDVGHVLGIPASGKKILDSRFSYREAKDRALSQFLPSEFKELRSIKLVQEVIERQYVYPISKSEVDRFKTAFVVFVASNLLSPSAKYDYACVDYWNGIQDPDAIAEFDWAEYVILRLKEAVTKLKQDLSSNIRFPNIIGCSIFLQVLYLDSLKLDGMMMMHNTLPRIRVFSYDKLRCMIAADRNYSRHLKGDDDRTFSALRDASDCIYYWAVDHRYGNMDSRSGSMLAVWECAVAMVHLLNVPLEAAGPLFVAAADFHDQINAGLSVTGMEAIKFMSVLVSIMIPYSRGFRYQSSYGVDGDNCGINSIGSAVSNGLRMLSCPVRNKRMKRSHGVVAEGHSQSNAFDDIDNDISVCSMASSSGRQGGIVLGEVAIGDDVKRSIKSTLARVEDVPQGLKLDMRVATTMSKFYACLRTLNPARSFDLNALSPESAYSSASSTITVASDDDCLPSPWELGYSWSVSDANSTALTDKLKHMEGDDRLVIIHKVPKHIQVSGRAMRAQLLGNTEFELDLFDALIRLVRQEDDDLYSMYGELRWRHFFESDFMAYVLSGSFDLLDCNLRNFLGLGNRTYDLSKSKLVFFPTLLQCRWVCFVWHLEDNLISVFEPSHSQFLPRGSVEAIESACYLLMLALKMLCQSAFAGVRNDVTSADLQMITPFDHRLPRFNRTGVLCSLFCRCYDGTKLVPNVNMVDFEAVGTEFLNQMNALKDNHVLLIAEGE